MPASYGSGELCLTHRKFDRGNILGGDLPGHPRLYTLPFRFGAGEDRLVTSTTREAGATLRETQPPRGFVADFQFFCRLAQIELFDFLGLISIY